MTAPARQVAHPDFGAHHDPLCGTRAMCGGCDARRKRLARNDAAGRVVGVTLLGPRAQQPMGHCIGCKASAYGGRSGVAPCWAWNHDVDRCDWVVEGRAEGDQVPAKCVRCRRSTPKGEE